MSSLMPLIIGNGFKNLGITAIDFLHAYFILNRKKLLHKYPSLKGPEIKKIIANQTNYSK